MANTKSGHKSRLKKKKMLPLAQVISAKPKINTVESPCGCTSKMDYVTSDLPVAVVKSFRS